MHIWAAFPYRCPPAQGIIEKSLYGLGTVFRGMGGALDSIGAMIQGPAALNESVQPNLAWAPTMPDASRPPTGGQLVKVPAITKLPPLREIIMPTKGDQVFIAPTANVMGDVKLGSNTSIWYGAVLRGDVNAIHVGSNTNIQDNATVHVSKFSLDGEPKPTIIGNNVTIGHGATVHACTIKDNCLIGMGATVLDGVVVEEGSIVAAGAIVPPRTHIPSGQVWAGNPAKKLRDVEPEEVSFITSSATNYSSLADVHRFECGKTFEELKVESSIRVDRYYASDPSLTFHQIWELDAQTLVITRAKK